MIGFVFKMVIYALIIEAGSQLDARHQEWKAISLDIITICILYQQDDAIMCNESKFDTKLS